MRFRRLLLTLLITVAFAPAANAALTGGRVGGVVVAERTPQLGAIVIVTPVERPGGPLRLVTDARGLFSSTTLAPGLYSVRVRAAGFLPAFQPRVRVTENHLTLLRIELGSLFSSIEQLRHDPRPGQDPDEWAWVLRSASATRPVLRYSEGKVTSGDQTERDANAPHGRAELTAGSLSAWSPADTQPLGTSSFLYDQGFGEGNRLLLAGVVGYEHSPSAGVAATWVHSSADGTGATSSTTIIFRQSQLGPDGPSFRGIEIDSIQKLQIGDHAELDYGGRYIVATLGGTASMARPDIRLRVKPAAGWTASFLVGSDPNQRDPNDPLDSLNSFTTPVEAEGRLALDRAWHEEFGVDRALGRDATLSGAVFHDTETHAPIFGRGPFFDYNTIADPYSDAFVYNGGAMANWGARVGYHRKLSTRWQAAVLYDWSRALAPGSNDLTPESLRSMIIAERRDLVGGQLRGNIERTGTEISAGYEWVDGPILTRPDPYGASLYGIDPYLNVSVRQPLPNFLCCRIVALIDVRNLLAQGYVTLDTGDGRAILIPAARAIRGGFAVQF
jgi:Carboxypeptidase regulatory-like domain